MEQARRIRLGDFGDLGAQDPQARGGLALLLKVGQTGRLMVSALPWDTVAMTIERITPMASVVDGRNVFEIEARPLQAPRDLRPGLRGVARIEVGRDPLLRVWSRRVLDHLSRFVWRWAP